MGKSRLGDRLFKATQSEVCLMSKAKQIIYILFFPLVIFTFGEVVAGETGNMIGMTKAHNDVRSALGVQGLIWSDELADYAQEWANYLAKKNRCQLKHRPNHGKYKRHYGENLYAGGAVRWSDGRTEIQKVSPDMVVKPWAEEVKDYDYESNTCRKGKVCGHYTQIVWKDSTKLGCAMAFCSDKNQVWVCSYDPPGNYIGRKPY